LTERRTDRTDLLDLAGFGFFLILIGSFLILRPDIPDLLREFLSDFELRRVGALGIPVPRTNHPALYGIVFDFSLAMLIFEIFALLARFVLNEGISKKASSLSGVVFWGGSAWILNMLSMGLLEWLTFLGWFVVVAGLSLITQSLFTIIAGSLGIP